MELDVYSIRNVQYCKSGLLEIITFYGWRNKQLFNLLIRAGEISVYAESPLFPR